MSSNGGYLNHPCGSPSSMQFLTSVHLKIRNGPSLLGSYSKPDFSQKFLHSVNAANTKPPTGFTLGNKRISIVVFDLLSPALPVFEDSSNDPHIGQEHLNFLQKLAIVLHQDNGRANFRMAVCCI
jgi:hypothetical protein